MTNVYPLKCRIRAEAGVTRVDIYDDIGEGGWFSEGLTAKSFAAEMATVKGPLHVHINSYGGEVGDGIAIGNTIRNHKGPKKTIVDGFAASIASVIAQAGDERVMEPGSMMMIHDALSGCYGNAADLQEMAGFLDKHSDNIAEIYASRAGGSAQQWRDTMRKDTWYTADEAVAAGLADKVGTGTAVLPAGMDVAAFTAVPGRIAAALRSLPVAALPKPQDAGARHEPMSGTHSHPHHAYGSQGSDAMHSHDHSHDGDASHAHDHGQSEPDGNDGTDDESAGGGQDHAPSGPVAGQQSCEDMGHQCCRDGGTIDVLTADRVRAIFREEIAAAQGVPGSHGDHERWDPDGDGDCDACPEGDTDNSHWAPDGTQTQDVPGKPMSDKAPRVLGIESMPLLDKAIAVHHTATSDEAWDGPAAVAAMPAEYADLHYCHAWQSADADASPHKAGDDDADDKKGAYKFPHHKTKGGPANLAACRNGLARLAGASIPDADRAGVEAHLNAHLKDGGGHPGGDDAEDHAHDDLSGINLDEIRAALRGER